MTKDVCKMRSSIFIPFGVTPTCSSKDFKGRFRPVASGLNRLLKSLWAEQLDVSKQGAAYPLKKIELIFQNYFF